VFLVTGATPAQVIAAGPMLLVVAGLLVGFGAVWGNGVCELPRLSLLSLVATLTFIATAIITVAITRDLL